jgi:hypothetical protein
MVQTNSWSQPASGFGYARSACLAPFASSVPSVSGMGYLVTGSYEPGDIYIFDGSELTPTFISPSTDPAPAPTIFGDWVYYILSGQLPTAQSSGGVGFLGGGFGGVNWVNTAYSGNFGLKLQTTRGGILGFDSAIPALGYTIQGNEVFSLEFQVLDTIPNEIVLQLFDSTVGSWFGIYLGPTELFGLGTAVTYGGNIAPVIGQWQQVTFTPAQIGLNTGDMITGVSWGVWDSLTTSTVVFSDTTNLNSPAPPAIIGGYIDCDQDGSAGYYVLGHTGPLIHVPAVSAPPQDIALSLNPSFDYTGLVYNSTYKAPYFIGYDGSIYNYSIGLVNSVTGAPSGVSTPARWLYTDGGNNLYTMFSNSLSLGTYNINSNAWVVTGVPFTATLDTFSYSASNGNLIAGGSSSQSISIIPTILDMAFSSQGTSVSGQVLVLDDTPEVGIYNISGGGLSLAQTLSLTGSPVHIATTPLGDQALVTDTSNNLVDVLTNLFGVWTKTSTVSAITAPTSLTVFTSGLITQALVCQPTNNTITVLDQSGTIWTPTQTLSVNGAVSAAANVSGSVLSGIAATSSGVTFLNSNGAAWSVGASLTISHPPTLVVADQIPNRNNGLFYGAGISGGNTIIYIFQNAALINQYTITGNILGLLATIDWEVIVPSSTGNLNIGYYVDGLTGNTQLAGITPVNPVAMAYASSVLDYVPILFIAGPHTIRSFYNDSPQSYTQVTDSQVAILSGSSWTTIDVQNRNRVSSITTDSSGNIFAVTTDNYLYKWNSAGVLAANYPWQLIPPLNQIFGIPIGAAKLCWWRDNLYCASSLAGGVIDITP